MTHIVVVVVVCVPQVELDMVGNIIVDPSYIEKQFRTPARYSWRAHSMYAYRDALREARRLQVRTQLLEDKLCLC